jgi:putative copper export protein
MLAPALDIVRLSVHVTAAAIWVGGQIVMAGLVPTMRQGVAPEVVRAVARRFADMAWAAFVVLVITGFWNVAAVHPSHQTTAWQVVFATKMVVVVLAGVSAALHQMAKSRTGLAVWGSLSGTAALVALVLGVALAG